MKRRISNPEDHRGNWAYNNDMSKYLGKRQKDKPKPKPKELSNDQQSIINSLA
jgi:hypothetical protein|tara:strand:- start:161 stop:319 length:159 start_codon:yes stop_codon:yes gene_type:complete